MKWLIYIFFLLLFAAVTFFGLGPVLMADGSPLERIVTLAVVLLLYLVLVGGFIYWRKRY